MDIIIFSTADWNNPFWTNKQHMAKTFEKNNHRVIYIDSLGLRKPTATVKDIKRIFRYLKSLFTPYTHISTNIWKITPFVIPIHSNKIISFLNKWILVTFVKALSYYLGFKKTIIWTYSPITSQIVDSFKDSILVYHCVDDLSAFPGIDSEMIQKMEKTLTKKSNFIFTTSKALHNKLKILNPNTYYQNNVCDYNHFSTAKDNLFNIPDDIKYIEGKKILFIGALSEYKVDFNLIKYIANLRPKWQWIMIGEIGEGQPNTDIESLMNLENLYFLGAKEYKELPKYLQYCDVTVIPAQLNQYTKSMFPMKFFEYLSSGKQVVSTNLSSLYEYKDIYYNSNSKEDFLKNLELILEKGIHKDKDLILKNCLKQTWQNRYNEMMRVVNV